MIQKEEDCGEREEMVVKTRRDQRKKEERDEEEQSGVAASSICLPPSHAEEVVSAQLERVGRTMDGKGGLLAKKGLSSLGSPKASKFHNNISWKCQNIQLFLQDQ